MNKPVGGEKPEHVMLPTNDFNPRRGTSARSAKYLLLVSLSVALPLSLFAAGPGPVSLRATPNQTTDIPASTFAAVTSSTNATPTIGLSSPYSSRNGTVTVCDGNINYTPAQGFLGNDTFNVTLTNSNGSVTPAVVNVSVQISSALAMQPDHTVQLQLVGAAGSNYNILASTNLITWTTIGSAVAGTNGAVLYTDTNASNYSTRFYRISP